MELILTAAISTILHWTLWTLISIVVTFTLWYAYWKTTRNKRLIDQIPGYKDWPIVGDWLHFPTKPVDRMPHLMRNIENVRPNGLIKIKFLEVPWIFLFASRHVERLLTSSKHINKFYEYFAVHPWLGMGLLTSSGEAWRARRHMLTPSFHFSILKDFLEVINEHAVQLTEKLQLEKCDTGEAFDIYPLITLNTLDIICVTAMGVEMEALNDGGSDYVKALNIIKRLTDERPRKPLYLSDLIYNLTPTGQKCNKAIEFVHEFAYKIIRERRELKKAGRCTTAGKRRPFLDLLLDCQDEQGHYLTDEEIREEVDTFMFEGHDTTASAISFTLYLLGANKEIQKKCQKEVDQVFASSESLSREDLGRLNYLEWTIKEAMRIFPPVPFFGRSLEEEFQFGDFSVPKGTTVAVFTPSLHRDPQVFPDPEKFDPTRFSPENCAKRSPFAYVPFSAGPRNCIGQKFAMMEVKVIIATLLKNFDIESVQTREELKLRGALVLLADAGIKIKLSSRS